MKIESYNQLIKYITDNNLKPEQAVKLIERSLMLYLTKDYDSTEEVIKDLNNFWIKWQSIKEKPLFIDAKENKN